MICILFNCRLTIESRQTLQTVITDLKDRGVRDITILLSCEGGQIYQALEFRKFIKADCGDISFTVINIDKVLSSGTILFLSFNKNSRQYLKGAKFHFHAAFKDDGELTKDDIDRLSSFNEQQIEVLSEETTMAVLEIRDFIDNNKERNILDEEIEKFGFAQKIDELTINSKVLCIRCG